MANSSLPLFPDTVATTGVMSAQQIKNVIDQGHILSDRPIEPIQLQPSSLDLRLGARAYRVRAGFLPGPQSTVLACLEQQGDDVVALDLSSPQIFERDHVYIVPLMERMRLPRKITGKANPKSSTGRLDIFTRLITDYGEKFDRVPEAYTGPLYAEISPRSFSVRVHHGATMNQLRFIVGSPPPSDRSIRNLHASQGLVYADDGTVIDANIARGLTLSIDLALGSDSGPVGYIAKNTSAVIDIGKTNYYETEKFWKPITRPPDGRIIIEPNHFYILASKELVRIPSDYAAEMIAFDPVIGEFRAHYAGFFDPGFGDGDIQGVRAVLEVKAHYVPFSLRHGQVVARMIYERMMQVPHRLYGRELGSSYYNQGLTLSKHFIRAP
ncbi:MAG: 2'-deoxycytidine 5'-triphosphate deaminase [Candidatus Thiosymbion ectosymbiont of Robbea hypermnestra]|nr:2'-deoxycytidine 5'-triphosphate deaminase [Candidatus Thiosymbion ectosymbiont of Robbea hypermnestra]